MYKKKRRPEASALEPALKELLIGQRLILMALNINFNMENIIVADFTALVDKVEKLRGAAAGTNAFLAELQAQLAAMAAGMNDAEDQAKVVALAADIDAISGTLPQAVAANPLPAEEVPAEVPAETFPAPVEVPAEPVPPVEPPAEPVVS